MLSCTRHQVECAPTGVLARSHDDWLDMHIHNNGPVIFVMLQFPGQILQQKGLLCQQRKDVDEPRCIQGHADCKAPYAEYPLKENAPQRSAWDGGDCHTLAEKMREDPRLRGKQWKTLHSGGTGRR